MIISHELSMCHTHILMIMEVGHMYVTIFNAMVMIYI